MEAISMTQNEFYNTVARDNGYLRIEESEGTGIKSNANNIVGFIDRKAVAITDLTEQQLEYYAQYKEGE